MASRRSRAPSLRKRRTTLTLPEESLAAAARLARSRRVNLSTVVAEALSEGLRSKMAIERSEEVVKSYQEAFAGFSDAELQILDGVILEPEPKR